LDNPISQWETNMDAYMTQAKADGFYVVAMTLTPYSISTSTPTDAANFKAMNDYLRRSTIPDLVIDANQMFSNPLDTNWFSAGLQPTAAAQRTMAHAMNSIFQSGTNPQNPDPIDFNNPVFATINNAPVVVQPPAGVPISTGTAWGPSIDPATIGPVKSVNSKVGVVVLNSYDVGAVLGPVASPDSLYFNTVLGGISATFDTVQARVPIWTPTNACNFQVVFPNSLNQSETGGPPLTVRAALEYPEGVFWPLYFNGVRDGALAGQLISAGGGMLISDPLGIDMTAKVVGWIRYRVIRTPGSVVGIPAVKTFGVTSGTAAFFPNTTTAIGGKWDNLELLITRTVTDGAMASGSAVFTSLTAAFTPQDAGQNITVATAGAAGATLSTTILTFTNATTVTLAASNASGAAVSGASTTISPADKTTGGTIYNGQQSYGYAPFAVLGQVGINLKTAGLVGDSITAGTGATVSLTGGVANIQGSWAVQSLNQAGVIAGLATREAVAIPYINSSLPGETVANLIVNHAMRFSLLSRCKYILGMIGTNDIFTAGATAATLEANLVTLWRQEVLRQGQPWYGTIVPQTTSTDVWLTVTNQTVKAQEPVRVAVNNWLRDGAPVDNTTGLPVAVGTSPTTANRAAFYDMNGNLVNPASGPGTNPASGLFDLANAVESAQNSGKWAVDPTNRTVTDATTTTGSPTISSATANFTSADVGRVVTAPGLVAGSNIATIQSVQNSTTATIAGSGAVTGGTNLTMTIAGTFGTTAFIDGIHPNSAGHKAMGATAALVIAHWV
jgi:lysophospholipase L1-like esterase